MVINANSMTSSTLHSRRRRPVAILRSSAASAGTGALKDRRAWKSTVVFMRYVYTAGQRIA